MSQKQIALNIYITALEKWAVEINKALKIGDYDHYDRAYKEWQFYRKKISELS